MTFIPLSQLLARGRADDHPVAVGKGRIFRFREFQNDVRLNASVLKSRGESTVVLVTEDSYHFCVGLLAILHAGCQVVLPVNGQPGTLEKHREQGTTILSDVQPEGDISSLGILSGGEDSGSADFDFDPLPSQDRFISFYTSGSTGAPQRIEKKLVQLEKEAEVLERYWGDVAGDARVLATVSHQHLYGLTFKVLWSLSSGRPFFSETFSFWEALILDLEDPCCLVTSPAHLSRIPPLERLSKSRQPRLVVTAGAPLSWEDAQHAEQVLGGLPMEIFGSTETGVVAYRYQSSEVSPWTALDVVQAAIGDGGALKVRSAFLDTQDWYQMNDLVAFSDDGRFLLKGRADRIVKLDGKRVSLPEIESFLVSHPWIDEAAVLVLDDDRGSLAVVTSLSAEGQALRTQKGNFRFGRQLRDEMRPYFDSSALPRRWRFVERVPVNMHGKRLGEELKALFE
jgi:acyl-coenzyme A synthetase/AMP-(fatty) acid ligase